MNTATFQIKNRKGEIFEVIVDADRYDEVTKYKWRISKGRCTNYVVRWAKGQNGKYSYQYLHQFLIGKAPSGMVVDHISNDGLDNRISNLRFCTPKENGRNRGENRPKIGSPKKNANLKGVSFNWNNKTKPWKAQIGINGVNHPLGSFPTAQLAHEAYCKAAREYHGEFFNPGTHTTEAHQ